MAPPPATSPTTRRRLSPLEPETEEDHHLSRQPGYHRHLLGDSDDDDDGLVPVCRVCRSDDPSLGSLFHPCRCTGSIAHVHQDCLSTWLSHSKKSSCELCGHLFSFEKVYKPGSPLRPPIMTITLQAIKEIANLFLLAARASLVGLCWLAIVPWTVVWVSTAYWKAADWFALGLTSNLEQSPSHPLNSSQLTSQHSNNDNKTSSSLPVDDHTGSASNTTLFGWTSQLLTSLDLDPNSIALDIFQGQLITCAIILSFVVVFLLREWILQNTPPPDVIRLGEDEDLHPLPPPQPDVVGRHQEPLAGLGHAPPPPSLPGVEENQAMEPEPITPPRPTTSTLIPLTRSAPNLTQHSRKISNASRRTTSIDSSFSTQDFSTRPLQTFNQFLSNADLLMPTPSLFDLADPGLGTPFYQPHDPLDPENFAHQILVTSIYMVLLGEISDAVSMKNKTYSGPRSFGDPSPTQLKLIDSWTALLNQTILNPNQTIPESIKEFRRYVLTRLSVNQSEQAHYESLELKWTSALLSDPKVSKHIQSIYHTQSFNSRSSACPITRRNGLIYSILSIYILIESFREDESWQRIIDSLRLFVLPLVRSDEAAGELKELQDQITHMVESCEGIGEEPASVVIERLKEHITRILVNQNVLSALITNPTFAQYTRALTFDENLFTNRRLKSLRAFVDQYKVKQGAMDDPHNVLNEIVHQLVDSSSLTHQSRKLASSSNWIDSDRFHHQILVTTAYLIFSGEDIDQPIPVLEHQRVKDEPALESWTKFAKRSSAGQQSSDLLSRFRLHSLRVCHPTSDDQTLNFQRLEYDWLSKLLGDPIIVKLILMVLDVTRSEYHSTQFFILKLIYVHVLLAAVPSQTDDPSMIADSLLKYLNAVKLLEEHLGHLDRITKQEEPLIEIIRETRFLLDSCRCLDPEDQVVRHRAFALRLRRGTAGILVRQRLLRTIVDDHKFIRYARAMLFDEHLFSHQAVLTYLEDTQDEMEKLDRKSKGKQKATDSDRYRSSADDVMIEDQSRVNGDLLSTNQSPHLNAFNWLEAGEETPMGDGTGFGHHSRTNNQVELRSINIRDIPIDTDSDQALPLQSTLGGTPAPRRQASTQRSPQLVDIGQDLESEGMRLHPSHRLDTGQGIVMEDVGPPLPLPPPPAALGAAGDGFGFEDGAANGPDDELMAEDIDGILELIGMKGSLLMLAQNVGLMTMLLSLSLLAFVHLPHMIGKIAVLSRAHRLFIPPLKGLLILRRLVHRMLDYISHHLKLYISRVEPSLPLHPLLANLNLAQSRPSSGPPLQNRRPITYLSRKLVEPIVSYTQESLPKLSIIWLELNEQITERLNRIAYGSRPTDRALAVVLGYLELVLLSLVYLSSGLDQQRARFVSETIVNGMRQQVLIAKVGIFIFVELVVFPFLCGLLLNLTMVPIFPSATVMNRVELYGSSPYSSILITWLAGTCFMFTFASLVSTCRESLRAGVCWWIRDPSDDRFNPIREILERPAWSQVKKITASAVMYGTVIVLGLGAVVFGLIFFTGTLPLRIHPNRALSSSAFDLVLYQNVVPLFLNWFQPRMKLKKTLQSTSRFMARKLRLTCYLYGERRIAEETKLEIVVYGSNGENKSRAERSRLLALKLFGTVRQSTSPSLSPLEEDAVTNDPVSTAVVSSAQAPASKVAIRRHRTSAGGSFARVPATDSVKVVPGRKMHIPVQADGTPIDPGDLIIIEQQRAEAREEMGGSLPDADQYTVVYLPPHFKLRMSTYVSLMWTSAVIIGWMIIGIPLLVGRSILDQILMVHGQEPHDVYAYSIGVLVCALLMKVGEKWWQTYEERRFGLGDQDEAGTTEMLRGNSWKVFKRKTKDIFHLMTFGLGVGFVLPILSSVIVELYVLGLLKTRKTGMPSIYLLQSWSYGCIYVSIGARVLGMFPNWVATAQEQILSSWRAGRVIEGIERANWKIVIPIGARILAAILLPVTIFGPIVIWIPEKMMKGFLNTFGMETMNRKEWFYTIIKSIYPIILSWYSHYLTIKFCFRGFGRWMEKVRDEKFLERRRLKNYDPKTGKSSVRIEG